jgi:hypothetical protein
MQQELGPDYANLVFFVFLATAVYNIITFWLKQLYEPFRHGEIKTNYS